jgi:hypothetical protein
VAAAPSPPSGPHTPAPLTGQSPSAWSFEGEAAVLRSTGRGQEFVVGMTDGVRGWAQDVLTAGAADPDDPILAGRA